MQGHRGNYDLSTAPDNPVQVGTRILSSQLSREIVPRAALCGKLEALLSFGLGKR